MRLLATVGLSALGVVLLLLGAAGAALVGSDDTVLLADTRAGQGSAYTSPSLLSVRGVDVVVAARAERGDVLVAAGHPVDVADVVDGVATLRIDRVRPGAVVGVDQKGGDLPALDRVEWLGSRSGPGRQMLVHPVGDVPPQVVVASARRAPVTVEIGFRYPGAFLLCLGVAVVGSLLLVLAWLGRRRHRRRQHRRRQRAGAGVPVGSGNTAARARTPLRAAALALTGALVVAGCAGLPAPVEAGAPLKQALRSDQVAAMWADYDVRNNAAIAAARPPRYDATGWAEADVGPALAAEEWSTAYARAARSRKRSTPRATTGTWASAPLFSTYPMHALSDREVTAVGEKEEKGARDQTGVALVQRDAATQPWRLRAEVTVPTAELPDLPEVVEPATPVQRRQADLVVEAVDAYLETGRTPTTLSPGGLRRIARAIAADRKRMKELDRDGEVRVHLTDVDDTPTPIWPTGGGAVVVVERHLTFVSSFSHDGWGWKGPWAQVRTDNGSDLMSSRAVTALVEVPTDGTPRVLGVHVAEVR